jgi:hypothetical protein
MTSSQPAPKKKMTKRGQIAILAFATVLVSVIGGATYLSIITPPKDLCVFKSDSSIDSASNQTSVVLAPTSNFVDIDSLVSRAGQDIKSSLGFSLKDENKKEALNREFSLVVADSSPKLIVTSFIDPLNGTEPQEISTQIESTFGYLELAAGCAGGYLAKDDDQVALESQSDFLKALAVASDQLSHTGEKNLYILGNGIQTSGAILMQEEGVIPASESAAKKIARELFNRDEVPALKDITVNWYGLGQVDGEIQEPLPLAKAKALEAFWSEIIRLAGGSVGEICGQCGSGLPNENAIPVDLVPVNECPITVKLYDFDGVEFQPDSSAFVSEAKAKAAAAKTASEFKSRVGCETLTIRGVAAAGEDKATYLSNRAEIDDINKELTKLRAEAFGALLKKAGFKGSLTFVGGGTCLTEWGASGRAIPDLQRKCRRVEIY